MVMKKIFEGVFDDEVHANFLKFGRGEYKNKYLLGGKRQAKKWAIKAGAEYANFLVRKCLEKVSGSVRVKGVIVSTQNLNKEDMNFNFSKVSNFQGVRKHQLDDEIEAADILDFMDRFPRAFFALTFKGDGFVLKIKAKAPTSGKPGKEKKNGSVADFCSLKIKDKEIVDYLFFGVGDFQEASINHTINIMEIIYPTNMGELKPIEVRELAKRKGIVVREVVVDGIVKTSRAEFVV